MRLNIVKISFNNFSSTKIPKFGWLDNHINILLFGPPGLGKTHLAISIGLKAVEKGYIVSFERMTTLTKLLKTSEVQRMPAFRLNRILKSDLIIIDEIGYSPIDKKEANLFFNLIIASYEMISALSFRTNVRNLFFSVNIDFSVAIASSK